jgi:TATA-box binding protein (TBP) (component of TFIID and TFIIIB)
MQRREDLGFYMVKLCTGRSAYEALPTKGVKFSMKALSLELEQMGYTVTDYKSILIVKHEIETTIFPSGRLLIKCAEKSRAIAEAKTIENAILATNRKKAVV